MHTSSQAVIAAAELVHSSQLTESKTTRKNEAYLMVLATTRPYFIILMVRKHRSALRVQMCPVKFLQRSWEKYKQHEGERVLTVTTRLLLGEFCENNIFDAASSNFVGQMSGENAIIYLGREERLEMGHSVQLRLGLPPDLQEQLHLVLLPTSSSSSWRSWCCLRSSSPAVNIQDVVWEAQSDGQRAPFSDNLKQWRQLR